MLDKSIVEITKQARKYFIQQRLLVGEELYISDSRLGSAKVQQNIDNALADFEREIKNCKKCSLAKTRNHFVFGMGNPLANLMLIGEAPGEEEDIQGFPFVGKAGQLLDKILNAIDFSREEVFIANILKCRPPQNRDPLPEEIICCLPYLMKQFEIIQPKIVLALGRIAAQVLMKRTDSLSRMRGKVYNQGPYDIVVTYHPAALLRNPQWKRPLWEDVQQLRFLYDKKVGDKPNWHPPKK